MEKNVSRLVKRLFLLTFAVIFLILGIISVPTPLPIGFIFFAIGIALLVMSSLTVRRMLQKARTRYPRFNRQLLKIGPYLPHSLRQALNVSAPRDKS